MAGPDRAPHCAPKHSVECGATLLGTLPPQEVESNRYRPRRRGAALGLLGEDERLGDALPGLEDTIGQKHADIWIARARGTAGVFQLELTGETFDYYQEVSVNNG